MTRRAPQRSRRRGATTVEFALTAPVLFVVVFAAVEFSRACMLHNSIKIAAAEGARAGMVPGATAQECRDRALAELGILRVRQAEATVTPSTLLSDTPEVAVSLSVPVATNGYVFARFFTGKTMQATVTLRREVSAVN